MNILFERVTLNLENTTEDCSYLSVSVNHIDQVEVSAYIGRRRAFTLFEGKDENRRAAILKAAEVLETLGFKPADHYTVYYTLNTTDPYNTLDLDRTEEDLSIEELKNG